MFFYTILFLAVMVSVPFHTGLCNVDEDSSITISRLDFENADIGHIMKILSDIGNRNIIVDKDIEGQCSIYLRDVSWEEALVAVLKMNNLVAYEDMGLIKVLTEEKYFSQIVILKEAKKLEKNEKKLIEEVKVHVVKIHNARAEEVKATLDPLLGEFDKPSVAIRTNSLVFTVTDSSLVVINDIIKELDTETRQVSIEVKMVTVDAGYVSEIGVNWSAVKDGNRGAQTTIGEENKLLLLTYAGKISNYDINGTVAGLIDKNKAEIVSRPHITTQDNVSATISSGQQVPYLTYDDARNTVIELVDASTQLIVTPHILSEERILLEVDASRKSADGFGQSLKINEELAQVSMITSNGETAVIGGMRLMQESKFDSGIPILQNIPLLGQLFKYTKRENKKTDLIIFITPRIITEIESQVSVN